jgi:hypothetical protein
MFKSIGRRVDNAELVHLQAEITKFIEQPVT